MRWIHLFLFLGFNLHAQVYLQGRVIDAKRGLHIPNVILRDSLSEIVNGKSDSLGFFKIRVPDRRSELMTQKLLYDSINPISQYNFKLQKITLVAEHENYQTQFIPIAFEQVTTHLIIALKWQVKEQFEIDYSSMISEYDNAMGQSHISGPLNAYGDPITQAEQFDFGAVFYNALGASRYQRELVVQGMTLRNPFSGTINWNRLTGLNEAMRFRKNQHQFSPEHKGFGYLGGATYIEVKPSEFNPGTRIKTQFANRNYQWGYSLHHVFQRSNGWSGLMLISAREGISGLTKGKTYDALGGFVSIDKQLRSGVRIGLMAFYTPIVRGMSAPLTREVLRLKGSEYNPNWGWQDNTWRNSRERFSRMPMAVLSIYSPQDIQNKWDIQIGVTSGVFGQSRLNYSSGMNPFGHHYTKLPSYFLRQAPHSAYDYQRAFLAHQQFKSNGQINWPGLYRANRQGVIRLSKYLIQNETNKNSDVQGRWNFVKNIDKRQQLSMSISGRWTQERRYAEISDLLGGRFYYDRNSFYQGTDELGQWHNVDTRNKPLYVGDKIDYDYSLFALKLEAYGQYRRLLSRGQMVIGLGHKRLYSKRVGHMRHGVFQKAGESLGSSNDQWHEAIKAKIYWANYWNSKLSTEITAVYDQQLPLLEQTFVYSRYHNQRTSIERSPLLMGIFGQLRYQSFGLDMVCKPFLHWQRFNRQNGFFYSDHVRAATGLKGLVQRHLWNINQVGVGLRSGIKVTTGERLTWTAVHILSKHNYTGTGKLFLAGTNLIDHNPSHISTDPATDVKTYTITDRDRLGSRKVVLNGYRPAVGPQQIIHATLTYRDPSYWWAGIVLSHFSNRYVGLSDYRRSEDAFFYNANELGVQGQDYDLDALWYQEELAPVTLASIKMGVSWRIAESYISLFGSVQNLFNQTFVSGGFESSRAVYLPDLLKEQQRPYGPIFGNKYFPGIGRSYYLTCSINF